MPKNFSGSLFILFTALINSLGFQAQAQGCSDAGVCTLGSFKPEALDSMTTSPNLFKVGAFYGTADNAIVVYGQTLEYQHAFSYQWSAALKLTTLGQMGNDISVFGLSDLYANANFRLDSGFSLTAGLKVPLANGGASLNGLPLPMDYQSSLGTFDLILGMSYHWRNLQMVLALQQPISQNANAFFNTDYPEGAPLYAIQSTNGFQRSGDLILRLSYPIAFKDRWQFTPGLLPIYHLQNDRYTDANGDVLEIEGSQGLTLNANLYIDYELRSGQALQLSLGAPLVVREARPDGLTRGSVLNLEYRVAF